MLNPIILSIIIPVYNVEAYLSTCLNSVYKATSLSTEIICIDDGSTDNSVSILQKYASSHSNLTVVHQDHSGASAARNHGITIAKGEYIFFLDSDDSIIDGDNLSYVLNQAILHKTDIVFFNALVNSEKNYVPSIPECPVPISGIKLMQLFYQHISTIPTPVWIQLYNRDFLQKSGIQQKEGSFHEDELFTPEILYAADKTLCFDLPIINYRQSRPGAVTLQYGKKYYSDWINIGRDLFHFFSSHKAIEDVCFRQVFGVYAQFIITLVRHKIDVKQYILKQDYNIMHRCARTPHDQKCYRLFRINPKLMVRYIENTLPPIIRKFINRFL